MPLPFPLFHSLASSSSQAPLASGYPPLLTVKADMPALTLRADFVAKVVDGFRKR
jgi:hypothetical protein